jgi:short-subunit dehydrogenase
VKRTELADKVVVITGAASGIGRELAIRLADQGCGLGLLDIDGSGLAQVYSSVAPRSSNVTIHEVDVSNRAAVYQSASEIGAAHGRVDILINCAAVLVAETLEDISFDDFEWVMNVNFWGVVYATKAFLPFLKQRPKAHIVNLSSVDGIVPTPNGGPYAAAKAALRSFTETLFQELYSTNVSVTCVIPGGVKTNLHRNARFFKIACPGMTHEECITFFEDLALTSAQTAAQMIVDAIGKKRTRVLIGRDAQLIDLASRLMPCKATALAGYLSRNLRSSKFEWLKLLKRKSDRHATEP